MKKFFLLSGFLTLLSALLFFLSPVSHVYADYAECGIGGGVEGDTIYLNYSAHAQMEPETPDYLTVYADLYLGGGRLSWVVGESGAAGNYTLYDMPEGTYNFTVYGRSQINGGDGPSCQNSTSFTVYGEPVYGCTDPSAKNYNPSATDPDGSCEYEVYGCTNPAATNYNPSATIDDGSCNVPQDPPPGDFYIYNTACFNWPNPEIESNFTDSSGATSYSWQKWNGSSYQTLASGSYGQVDSSTDSNVSSGNTYYYRMIAENNVGSRVSNETSILVNAANCGGFPVTLTVSIGSGSGTVTSAPTGISCLSDCTEAYTNGEWVTLTATPGAGYTFNYWTGACAGQGVSCSVYMNTDKSAAVYFSTNSYTLTVAKAGNGSGLVTSSPGGINCGGTCSAAFGYNTVVDLAATASSNSVFAGWSGDCSGTGSCSVTMSSAGNVTATFNLDPFNYSMSDSGTTSVQKGSSNVFAQTSIYKTYLSGSSQSVSLSLSGVPSGVTYSVGNSTCAPTCTATITFTVTPSAAVGTHSIVVTGSPLSKTTSFNLVISGAPIAISCSANPVASALLGQNVLWSATINGGRTPFAYSWSGTNIPTSPAPSTSTYSKAYSTVGQKTAQLTVTDADGVVSTCPAATIMINFDPNFKEF